MRAFVCLVVAVFAAVVAASSNANPFKIPNGGYTFTAGQATTLNWDPTTGGTVSLLLQHGEVTTASEGTPIASNIANSGTYTWTVPSNLVNQAYTIEIISDSNQNDYNFLPRFTVAGATAASSSSAAPSSSSAAMTSTSAEPTTSTSESMSMTMTTMTTSTSTSTSTSSTSTNTDSSSSAAATSSEPSSSASSAPSSTAAVPTTNAGIANRVSGGMLAMVAGAIAVM